MATSFEEAGEGRRAAQAGLDARDRAKRDASLKNPQTDTSAANVERAGCALACPFSSSAEFEAAVIQSKRRAGVYGPRRHRRHAAYAGVAAGLVLLTLLII